VAGGAGYITGRFSNAHYPVSRWAKENTLHDSYNTDAAVTHNKAAIQKVIDRFVEGIRKLNPDLVSSVFHPKATSFSITPNGICLEPFDSWSEILKKAEADDSHIFNENFTASILNIDIVGTVASAKVEWTFQSCKIVDFYNLIETENGWLITNQVYHTTRLDQRT
jgi:hypothetical protein